MTYDMVKVFTATKARDRDEVGERATEWLRSSGAEVVDKQLRLSSDHEFHCLSLVLFCRKPQRRRRRTTS